MKELEYVGKMKGISKLLKKAGEGVAGQWLGENIVQTGAEAEESI